MKNTIDTIHKELASEIRKTGQRLLDTLDLFSPGQINVIPFEGSWTAGQVVDHILKSGSGVYEVILGPTSGITPGRPFDEKVEELKALFLNFSLKMNSPLEILPATSPLQKEQLQNTVQHLLSKIEHAARELNPEEACMLFEFPGYGTLTRYEWLNFFIVHTLRHIRQLKQICNTLNQE